MMRIETIELVEVVVPARSGAINSEELDKPLHKMIKGVAAPWSQQFDDLPKYVLIARCEDGTVGIGETLRDPDVAALRAMGESLIGAEVERLSWQALPWPRVREYDGFETLVLDLLGKRYDMSVSALLGGAYRRWVHVGAWSGHRTSDDAARVARAAVDRGMTCLKLKCDLEDDVVGIAEAVYAECGESIKLIFDPNERFEELRHAVRIARGLEQVGNVLCLEDPIPRWDLPGYAELRAKSSVPIAVHVALGYTSHGQSVHDLVHAFRARAVDLYNLSSGVSDFLRMGHIADAVHKPYWHGSEVDLGILEAANVHAAAVSRGCELPSDVFGRTIREHDLLSTPLCFDGPSVAVPDGPGLGVSLDDDAVDRYEKSRILLRG